MKNYFKNCGSIQDIKNLYRELAKVNHPDMGGTTEMMQVINNQYSEAIKNFVSGARVENKEEIIFDSEAYRCAIEKISHLEGIIIELVGNWIWVTGNTYPVKETLKAAGFFFASKKAAWYFRTAEYAVKNTRKKLSLEQIKDKYGSTNLSALNRKYLA